MLIESLQKFDHYFGDTLKVAFPTGSDQMLTLGEVATELSHRLVKIFLRSSDGKRPIYGGLKLFQEDRHWRDLTLFNEYFHGDNGAGLGASHQTGWTGLVAKLIQQSGGWREELDGEALIFEADEKMGVRSTHFINNVQFITPNCRHQ